MFSVRPVFCELNHTGAFCPPGWQNKTLFLWINPLVSFGSFCLCSGATIIPTHGLIRLHISGALAGNKHVPRDRGTKRSRASLQGEQLGIPGQQFQCTSCQLRGRNWPPVPEWTRDKVTERKSNGRAERRYLEEKGKLHRV